MRLQNQATRWGKGSGPQLPGLGLLEVEQGTPSLQESTSCVGRADSGTRRPRQHVRWAAKCKDRLRLRFRPRVGVKTASWSPTCRNARRVPRPYFLQPLPSSISPLLPDPHKYINF